MREFLESLAGLVHTTGGLALLALPAVVPLLLFGGLIKVGRGYWGRGTDNTRWAKDVLAHSTDELQREIARDILKYS